MSKVLRWTVVTDRRIGHRQSGSPLRPAVAPRPVKIPQIPRRCRESLNRGPWGSCLRPSHDHASHRSGSPPDHNARERPVDGRGLERLSAPFVSRFEVRSELRLIGDRDGSLRGSVRDGCDAFKPDREDMERAAFRMSVGFRVAGPSVARRRRAAPRAGSVVGGTHALLFIGSGRARVA